VPASFLTEIIANPDAEIAGLQQARNRLGEHLLASGHGRKQLVSSGA
jgi:hypothetical protein